MVYDWEDKESICYNMYIEEKKSLEEIMEYMKVNFQFAPSKRAFQTQFKRWDFPSKQHPAHKNQALVQRIKELWEVNTSQKDMLRILNEEGHEIKERELMRVRAKNRWLLRVANPNANAPKSKRPPSEQDLVKQLQYSLYPDTQSVNPDGGDEPMEDDVEEGPFHKIPDQLKRRDSPPLSPEVMQKRQERLAKLQAESAKKMAAKKRRRRTRGWAGLPADPPGPPRFPSETTIDESKTYLKLDSRIYRDVRANFQRLCEEEGIIKKTLAGPERWESVKDRLVQESPHLQSVLWQSDENLDLKKLSLDVICSDVTKRMRTMERRMTIAEAKNILGVNPEESRQLRNSFYQTLKADHFTSKLEAGDDHWQDLKSRWINNSPILQKLFAPGDADPQHSIRIKAMEVLCRDVMKRLRDDQTKRDPTRKVNSDIASSGIETQESRSEDMPPYEQLPTGVMFHQSHNENPHQTLMQTTERAQAQPQTSQPLIRQQRQPQHHEMHAHPHVMMTHDNMQIDPNLLISPINSGMGMGRGIQYQQYPQEAQNQEFGHQGYQVAPASVAVYFRLHPESNFQPNSRVWMSTLSPILVSELRELAQVKFPGTIALRVEGILKSPDGREMTISIDQDDELQAYLNAEEHLKPTFVVQLVTVNGY
ncbi:hypothetical protein BJ878DRAFT_531305 [Calycina marina]|uniref:Clr5 domain-containing protein n=1 Tax=Calycina marina TaxID=1763456 RepID=A0A9P7ZBZ8_9HELO|nr:hypothetical protein BJ878DRAFT_531305 [Calycina marina]